MFARIVELFPKLEKQQELLDVARREVLPVLRKQPGFLELLPFIPEVEGDRLVAVTLWAERRDVDRFVREAFPKVSDLVRPYLVAPITSRHYTLESSFCQHFFEALTA